MCVYVCVYTVHGCVILVWLLKKCNARLNKSRYEGRAPTSCTWCDMIADNRVNIMLTMAIRIFWASVAGREARGALQISCK